jgi:hypothetical protein
MKTAMATDRLTAIPNDPPSNWQYEMPKYRAIRAVHPSPNSRFRNEPPFASCSDNDCWQYGTRILKAGEIIETGEWPHQSFFALNYSARKVLEFFRTRQKSRMQRSPWAGDRLRLDDGLTGNLVVQAAAPQLQPMDLRPAS